MFLENTAAGVTFMTAPAITAKHAFTTRLGGVSTGRYESLNLGESLGDRPGHVRENFRLLCRALDIRQDSLVFSRQVHGDGVRVVTEADRRSLFQDIACEADALVTNKRDLPLIVFTADCVPILLHDEINQVAAAIHGGWRSTVMDICGKTVEAMEGLGARPSFIRAAIGPSIGKCCFEVGPEVPQLVKQLLGRDAGDLIFEKPGLPDKFLVDLKGVHRQRLRQLGVPPENIAVSDECTFCSWEKYWSHRKTKGERGSQAAVISL